MFVITRRAGAAKLLALFSILGVMGTLSPPLAAQSKTVSVLAEELDRNFKGLAKSDPAPYFLSYYLYEQESHSINATLGALQTSNANRGRLLDVSMRIGDPKLDNYRQIRGDRPQFSAAAPVPIDEDANSLRRRLWLETDRVYRGATQRLINIKSNQQVKLDGDDKSADFSPAPSVQKSIEVPALRWDKQLFENRARRWSAFFLGRSEVLSSGVTIIAQRELKTIVNSEGTKLEFGRNFARILISAQGKAADGMNLFASETFEADDPTRLPDDKQVAAAVEKVHRKLAALLKAPLVEPTTVPAILSGKAAGVFFHEIFGHRIEGHRQKDESEGQTFTKMVGTKILPEFLSVKMDPTLHRLANTDLYGWYDFDDEGVAARPVSVVKNGVLENFLMSRSPINGFPTSNGHGRKQPGAEIVSRQSNLVVESTKSFSPADLRKQLVEEIKKQNKPYGLYFEEVSSGFTITSRRGLQAFSVFPVMVYKVFADGRPDELVRGADIVGTPLTSFSKIVATSTEVTVFNGYCGAESGQVPVSASSPALLVSEIEISLRERSLERPPFLSSPVPPSAGGSF